MILYYIKSSAFCLICKFILEALFPLQTNILTDYTVAKSHDV